MHLREEVLRRLLHQFVLDKLAAKLAAEEAERAAAEAAVDQAIAREAAAEVVHAAKRKQNCRERAGEASEG